MSLPHTVFAIPPQLPTESSHHQSSRFYFHSDTWGPGEHFLPLYLLLQKFICLLHFWALSHSKKKGALIRQRKDSTQTYAEVLLITPAASLHLKDSSSLFLPFLCGTWNHFQGETRWVEIKKWQLGPGRKKQWWDLEDTEMRKMTQQWTAASFLWQWILCKLKLWQEKSKNLCFITLWMWTHTHEAKNCNGFPILLNVMGLAKGLCLFQN
jgi:hypothetical protein